MSILEEKLREAACLGDLEAVTILLNQNVDVNCKHSINGWTPLHWACKRGQEDVVKLLLDFGADLEATDKKGETPLSLCANPNLRKMLGCTAGGINEWDKRGEESGGAGDSLGGGFVPNYMKNGPLNGQVEVGPRFSARRLAESQPNSPPIQNQNTTELILKVRIAGAIDPDFIEVEIPRWNLGYKTLLHICCEELEVTKSQVERIRKLPNVRLRKDSDVKRLQDNQSLELVLVNSSASSLTADKHNGYQSISTCKDQTILY